jgi:hypothetical protein
MPNVPAAVDVAGGKLLQIDDSGPHAVYYVGVDILPSSSQTVAVTLDTYDMEAPTVTAISPNGGDVWNIGLGYDITWEATDDVGVKSVNLVLSRDGGSTYYDTLATGEVNDGSYRWMVVGEPTSAARIKVIAYDGRGNTGEDASDGDFEIHDVSDAVPSHLVITGTSPNPLNRHAVIGFGLPRGGLVNLGLYDVSGRLIMNIMTTEYPEGYQNIDWYNAGTVGSGIYFLKLSLGSDVTTQKVVILRH